MNTEKPQKPQHPSSASIYAPGMAPITPDLAAVKLQNRRGHLVIGFPPTAELPRDSDAIGTTLSVFGGRTLRDHQLLIERPTDRQDWDEQIQALYGETVPKMASHPAQEGQRFYRCRLEAISQ